MARRVVTGRVTSTPNPSTIHVEVERFRTHRLYGRRFRLTKRYAVERTSEPVTVGDIVEIEEIRPISKTKHFRFRRVITKRLQASQVIDETDQLKELKDKTPSHQPAEPEVAQTETNK